MDPNIIPQFQICANIVGATMAIWQRNSLAADNPMANRSKFEENEG